MGSLTRAALQTLPSAVAGAKAADVTELFAVGRALHDSPALLRALGDDSADKKALTTLIDSVFGGVQAGTKKLIHQLVDNPWSKPVDLLEGVEEIAIRLAATTASGDIAGELLSVDRVIKAQPNVQLALSGKRAPAEAKRAMVESLFGKKISAEALAIVLHLVIQPRNRRITESITRAAGIVCDQRGDGLAEVRVATAIGDQQVKTIATMLEAQYGRPHYIDQVVDQAMVGGIRIRVGDHVMDQSVATQLADMKRQLAS